MYQSLFPLFLRLLVLGCLSIFIHTLWVVFRRAIVWFIFAGRYLFLYSLDIYFILVFFLKKKRKGRERKKADLALMILRSPDIQGDERSNSSNASRANMVTQ